MQTPNEATFIVLAIIRNIRSLCLTTFLFTEVLVTDTSMKQDGVYLSWDDGVIVVYDYFPCLAETCDI